MTAFLTYIFFYLIYRFYVCFLIGGIVIYIPPKLLLQVMMSSSIESLLTGIAPVSETISCPSST